MSQNIISLVMTEAQINTAMDALSALEGALAGLISLDPEERRRLTKMGEKSEVFCRQAVSVLVQNPQIVPPSLHVVDAQADLLALDRLRPVLDRLQKLAERGSDTEIALGSDVMDVALEGYALLKVSGRNRASTQLIVRRDSTRRRALLNSVTSFTRLQKGQCVVRAVRALTVTCGVRHANRRKPPPGGFLLLRKVEPRFANAPAGLRKPESAFPHPESTLPNPQSAFANADFAFRWPGSSFPNHRRGFRKVETAFWRVKSAFPNDPSAWC